MKKIIALVLTLTMLLCMIPAASAATTTTKSIGTTKSALTTALASAGTNVIYELTGDINCQGAALSGLKLGAGCVLDGKGYKIYNFTSDGPLFTLAASGDIVIKNLTIQSGLSCATSVFGNIATTGSVTFSNVTVKLDKPTTVVGEHKVKVNGQEVVQFRYAGAFVNTIQYGKVLFANCTNSTAVTIKSDGTKNIYAGGFVGCIQAGTVSKHQFTNEVQEVIFRACTNTASITGDDTKTSYAGGFVGRSETQNGLYFDRCTNTGAISKAMYLGGLLGSAQHGYVSFVNSRNEGAITAREAGASHFGGLSGRLEGKANFKNCVNTGTLTGYAGNIGQMASKVDDVLTIDNCYALGKVNATSGSVNVGPLVGDVLVEQTLDANSKFLPSATYTTYYRVDKTADALTEQQAEALKTTAHRITGDTESESVVATPVLRGVQTTKVDANRKYKIRLIVALDTYMYQHGGFRLTVKSNSKTYLDNEEIRVETLYKTINATDDGAIEQHNATDPDMAGTYLMCLNLINAPATEELKVTVTPFMSASNVRYEGDTTAFTTSAAAATNGSEVAVEFRSLKTEADWEETFGGQFPVYTEENAGTLGTHAYVDNVALGAVLTTQLSTDDYKMFTVTGANLTEYNAYVDSLPGTKAKQASTSGITAYWVTSGDVQMYTYFIEATGEAQFILDNASTTAAEFTNMHKISATGATEFYLYSLYQNPVGVNIDETYPDVNNADYKDWLKANGLKVGDKNKSSKNTGMLLIIKLPDNSLIIVDGGQVAQMSSIAALELHKFLHQITDVTDLKETITIRNWYLTHWHGDHFEGFIRFMNGYHDYYDLKSVMFNLQGLTGGALATFLGEEQLLNYYPDLAFHRVHTGEKFQIGSVDIEVMYTQEDLVDPEFGNMTYDDDNDTSGVLRLTFDSLKLMVTGDLGWLGEATMLKMYPNSNQLKADVLQAPHHGWNNLDKLFPKIEPEVVLHTQTIGGVKYKASSTYTTLKNAQCEKTTWTKNSTDLSTDKNNHYFAGDFTLGIKVVNGQIVFSKPQGNETAGKVNYDDPKAIDGKNWTTDNPVFVFIETGANGDGNEVIFGQ